MKPRKSIIIAPLVQLQIIHKEQLFHNCSWNHENDEIKISIEYLTNLKSSLLLIASLDKDFSQLFLITSLDDPPFFLTYSFKLHSPLLCAQSKLQFSPNLSHGNHLNVVVT